MRKIRLFAINEDASTPEPPINAIHVDAGGRSAGETLSHKYDLGSRRPNIQVFAVNQRGGRIVTPRRFQHKDRPRHDSRQEVLEHAMRRLWGVGVQPERTTAKGEATKRWNVLGLAQAQRRHSTVVAPGASSPAWRLRLPAAAGLSRIPTR